MTTAIVTKERGCRLYLQPVIMRLDWDGWFRGLIGAIVSGGASSVSAGFGATVLDPGHDLNIFKLMAVTFGFSAFISLMKYLQVTPVPVPEPPEPAPVTPPVAPVITSPAAIR